MDITYLNTLAHNRADIYRDPRLRTLYNDYMILNDAPFISNVSMPASTGYKTYNNITDGDLRYYLSNINVPFSNVVFSNDIITRFTTAPQTPLKNMYIPVPIAPLDYTIKNPDLRKEQQYRTDLMAQQQVKRTTFDTYLYARN